MRKEKLQERTINHSEQNELKRKHLEMGRRRRQEINRYINVNVSSVDIDNVLYDYEEDEHGWALLLSNVFL